MTAHYKPWEECLVGLYEEDKEDLELIKKFVISAMSVHETRYDSTRKREPGDSRHFRMNFGEIAAEELVMKLIANGYKDQLIAIIKRISTNGTN